MFGKRKKKLKMFLLPFGLYIQPPAMLGAKKRFTVAVVNKGRHPGLDPGSSTLVVAVVVAFACVVSIQQRAWKIPDISRTETLRDDNRE